MKNSYIGFLKFILFSVLLTWVLSSCFEEKFDTSGDVKLTFSQDTITFDTVFTTIGSVTKSFKVYNPSDLAIKISEIKLENESSSFFRLNIDGIPGDNGKDVEIGPKDSIYVFCEVTIDPDQPVSVSPFVVQDKVVLLTNGNEQEVDLIAWGQNANYLTSRSASGEVIVLNCDGEEVLDDPKPYIIYGFLVIDTCILRVPAGARLHIHGGVASNTIVGELYTDGIIYVTENGKLLIDGTPENPVVITGDRLEPDYKDELGQWGGIYLSSNCKGSKFNHTEIKYAVNGISVDSAADLTLENSIIHGCSGVALISNHANITANNSLFYDNGISNAVFYYGGDYSLNHCTFANYRSDDFGLYMTNRKNQEETKLLPLNATINNCIISGSSKDELGLYDASEEGNVVPFQVDLNACIINLNEYIDEPFYYQFLSACPDCIVYDREEELFLADYDDDFRLDTMSIAIDSGFVTPIITDILGNPRDDKPDIGCYEFIK